MAKKKESLIVASKIKAYIKSKKMMTSSDALGAINDKLYSMLDCAAAPDQSQSAQHGQGTGPVEAAKVSQIVSILKHLRNGNYQQSDAGC